MAPLGHLYSWTVAEHQVHPGFPVPYTIVLVELDEVPGVRLVGHLPDARDLTMGMPMQATAVVLVAILAVFLYQKESQIKSNQRDELSAPVPVVQLPSERKADSASDSAQPAAPAQPESPPQPPAGGGGGPAQAQTSDAPPAEGQA